MRPVASGQAIRHHGRRKPRFAARPFLPSSPAPATPLPGLPQSRTFFDPKRANIVTNFVTQSSVRHDALVRSIQVRLGDRAPKSLCLIDMSDSADRPVQAGWEIERMVFIASVAKLAALYAAFQLREDLRAVVTWSGARTFEQATQGLRRAWRSAPSPSVKALADAPASDLPEIEQIFDVEAFDGGATPSPEFRSAYGAAAQQGKYPADFYAEVGQLHQHKCPQTRPDDPDEAKRYEACYAARYAALAKVQFNELLHLMTRWSDNEAASACISRLSLPFIKAMLSHSGLLTGQTGLWLGGVFRQLYGKSFRVPGTSVDVPVIPPVDPKAKRSKTKEKPPADEQKTTSTQAGNARALAILLATLVRGDLLPTGQNQMTATLDFSPIIQLAATPDNAYLFSQHRPSPTRYLSKIGIAGQRFSEAAYLLGKGSPPLRTSVSEPIAPPPTLSYVAVALQAPGEAALTETGEQLDKALDDLRR